MSRAHATPRQGENMAKESPTKPFGRLNRREMLGTTTALFGGAMVGLTGTALAETPQTSAAPAAATGPNLHPPTLQIKSGKLRGLR
jgi:nitrous oxide reductase